MTTQYPFDTFRFADNTETKPELNLVPSIAVAVEPHHMNIPDENGDPMHSQIRRALREVGFGRLPKYSSAPERGLHLLSIYKAFRKAIKSSLS